MAKKTAKRMSKNPTVKGIENTMKDVFEKGRKGKRPNLKIPVRSLKNVKYIPSKGYFELGKALKVRTLSVNTVKNFAQTLRMMSVSNELISTDDFASKREMYYISKNWEEARFDEQPESDTVMDDIEAMYKINREQLRFFPEEKGGEVAGQLQIIDKDRISGKTLKIDCTKFGSGAYSIPTSVEELKFETKAKFVLVIETAAAFQRMNSKGYWKTAKCILISMGGVPTRSCRRFIRRLSDDCNIPVYVFTDGDPYGYGNIYRTLKVGSGNAAHINKYFCVPKAKFLGVTPQDIKDHKMPTHPLKEVDIKRANDALKNDPFFKRHPAWQAAFKQMMQMGVRVEQQAFAKHGLNYVIEVYLPKKLKRPDLFLP